MEETLESKVTSELSHIDSISYNIGIPCIIINRIFKIYETLDFIIKYEKYYEENNMECTDFIIEGRQHSEYELNYYKNNIYNWELHPETSHINIRNVVIGLVLKNNPHLV